MCVCIFGGCGAWGSALYWLVNGGVAHIVATCLILIGWGVLFPMKTFSGFQHFSKQKPFDLYLSSFFPCYFFTFSLRLAFLTSLVAHFAHSLLSFLLIFRYALYLCSYPFWISFLFFFPVFPFPFRVVLFPLMVGYSEVERTSPSVAFLFTRLGALLESSTDPLGVLSPRRFILAN